MITFTDEHCDLVDRDLKTQTRRLGEKPHYKVGGRYAYGTNRFKPETARGTIQVTARRRERLHKCSPEDALAEGYDCVGAYIDAFYAINRRCLTENPLVWAYTFRRLAS